MPPEPCDFPPNVRVRRPTLAAASPTTRRNLHWRNRPRKRQHFGRVYLRPRRPQLGGSAVRARRTRTGNAGREKAGRDSTRFASPPEPSRCSINPGPVRKRPQGRSSPAEGNGGAAWQARGGRRSARELPTPLRGSEAPPASLGGKGRATERMQLGDRRGSNSGSKLFDPSSPQSTTGPDVGASYLRSALQSIRSHTPR